MKTVIAALSEVPAALQSEYAEHDGAFHLKLEGVTPRGFATAKELADANGKVAEFRDNNRGLNTTKTELENKLKLFDGIDPAKYTEIRTKLEEIEKGGVKDKGDINTIVQNAVKQVATALQTQIDTLTTKLTAKEEEAKASAIEVQRKGLENSIQQIGVKAGVDEKALPDFVRRGLETFVVEDGEPVAKRGDTPLYSKTRPGDPLTLESWAAELTVDAPHLFKPSKGGGANNGQGGGSTAKKTIGSDPLEFGRNLEEIAKGNVLVQQ